MDDEVARRLAQLETLVWSLAARAGGGGSGTVTEVDGAEPIFITGDPTTIPTIGIHPATTSDPGSLAAADQIKLNALSLILSVPIAGFIGTTEPGQTSTPTVDMAQAWPSMGLPPVTFTLVIATLSVTPENPTDHVQIQLTRDDLGDPLGATINFIGQGAGTVAWIDSVAYPGGGTAYRLSATNLDGGSISYADGQSAMNILSFGVLGT